MERRKRNGIYKNGYEREGEREGMRKENTLISCCALSIATFLLMSSMSEALGLLDEEDIMAG